MLNITREIPQRRFRKEFAGGFTLIEILVVVAIIAILAAIAVPNLLEAQIRARVSRTKSDMRTLALGVEAYHVDNNAYPFRRNVVNMPGQPAVPEAGNRLEQMKALTTPIAYLVLPVDLFEKRLLPPNNLIDYWDPVQTSWLINYLYPLNSRRRITEQDAGYLLVSVGPDGYLGQAGVPYGWPYPADHPWTTQGTVYRIYDPTNGTISIGNIYGGTRGVEGEPHYLQGRFGF
jgi:prepilin-type N-terminal cleavage/methylation domain-containing protein